MRNLLREFRKNKEEKMLVLLKKEKRLKMRSFSHQKHTNI